MTSNSVVGGQIWPSKILCMSSLPESFKMFGSIATEKRGDTDFKTFNGSLLRSQLSDIWSKFDLIQAFMVVLVTC